MTVDKNRMLLICSGFPPEQGGGVIRQSRIAKYLPEFGWLPIVLTTKPRSPIASDDPAAKYALNVIRCMRLDPAEWWQSIKKPLSTVRKSEPQLSVVARGASRAHRISEYIFVPDTRILWACIAAVKGTVAVLKRNIRVIYSTSPDASCHLVGLFIKLILRVPWIIEFRDLWISNPFRVKRRSRLLEALENRLEAAVIRRATKIIVVSEPQKNDILKRYPGINQASIVVIPNGFDPADFENCEPHKFSRFTISHVGNFYGKRSAVPLIAAWVQMLNAVPQLRTTVCLALVGEIDLAGRDLLAGMESDDCLLVVGRVTHSESLRYMCGSNGLIVVPGPDALTGKIFEYIAADRLILCLSESGPAKALVERYNLGMVTSETDVNAIARALQEFITLGGSQWSHRTEKSEIAQMFNRRYTTRTIAHLLNDVTHQ